VAPGAVTDPDDLPVTGTAGVGLWTAVPPPHQSAQYPHASDYDVERQIRWPKTGRDSDVRRAP